MRQSNRKKTDFYSILQKLRQLGIGNAIGRIFSTKRAKIIGLICAVLVVALTVTLIAMPSSEEKEAAEYLESLENVDDDTLAGLRGDDSAFVEQKQEFTRIAVISGSGTDKILAGVEASAEAAVSDALIDGYYIYLAADDVNQLIQDMRSVVNKGCKAVILAGLDEYMFNTACGIAANNNIAVIALDAPASGYSLNIKSYDSSADNAAYTGGAPAFEHTGTGAADKLKKHIAENGMPKFCCVDATSEFLQLWKSLSTTGIVLETTTPEGLVQSMRYARGESKLYARVSTSSKSIGELLARAACLAASGRELTADEFALPAPKYITNENYSEYLTTYSDGSNKLIGEDIDPLSIDAVFEETTK